MWNNQLPNNSNQPNRPTTSRPDGTASTNSPEYAAAAALARRMVYPGYDASALPPSAGSGYYDDSMWTHQQRQREMELIRLQRMQEQGAYMNAEEARRNRLLELELSVNQMQEYERAQIQLQMMRDMQHHEAMADGGRRLSSSVGAVGPQYAGMEANVRQQQIAEYLAGQRSRAVDDDAEAWLSSSSTHSQRKPSGASSQKAGSQKAPHLKIKSESEKSSGVTAAAATKSSPKRTKGTSDESPLVNNSANGIGAVKKYSYPPPQPDSDANKMKMLDQKQPASPKKKSPDAENQTPSAEPVSTIAPAEKHASKTLAHLKAIQESHEAKDTTPSKATKKRRLSPAAKKTDSLASLPDKPSAGKGGKKKSPGVKAKLQSPRTMMNHMIKSKPGVPTVDDPVPPITESHYQNLDALMNEFCKVPFLAEFSRPVALLHPEVSIIMP